MHRRRRASLRAYAQDSQLTCNQLAYSLWPDVAKTIDHEWGIPWRLWLQVRMYEGLKVHPLNMRCFARGAELADDLATLSALDVAADDVVNVVRDGEEEDYNVESVIAYQESMCGGAAAHGVVVTAPQRQRGKERGFAHTALVGSAPVVAPAAAAAAASDVVTAAAAAGEGGVLNVGEDADADAAVRFVVDDA